MVESGRGESFLSKEKIAKALIAAAAAALLSSVFFPYWWLKVTAPQYPKGLKIAIFVNHLEGDVQEVDILNHYIGMRPLREGAKKERELAVYGISVLVLCLGTAVFVRNKFSIFLLIPTILFPAIFAADLYFWLRDFGLHLNPKAPLSSSIKPFIPPLLGYGKIAQFKAQANFAFGHGLAMLAALLSLSAIALRFFPAKKKAVLSKTTMFLVLIFLAGSFHGKSATAAEWIAGSARFPTIQSALEASLAGDTIFVNPGIYQGPLEVKKSVTLIGHELPVIDGGGEGTVVKLESPGIRFEGFLVRNSGGLLSRDDAGILATANGITISRNELRDVLFGIYLKNSPKSALKDNRLYGKNFDLGRRGDLIRIWYSHDVRIERNKTFRGRDAVLWYSKNAVLRGNNFQNGRYGVHFMYCQNAVVEANTFSENSVGAYLMYSEGLKLDGNFIQNNRGPSGFGIGFKDMENAEIRHNVVTGNRVGFFIDSSSGGDFHANLVAYNDKGFEISPSVRKNKFSENNIVDNVEQVTLDQSSVFTVNEWQKNFWSDYRGYDADRDGIGDVAYRPMKLYERLTDRFHDLKIFFSSPSVYAIDFAANTFPVFAPTPKFEDLKPLVNAVPLSMTIPPPVFSYLWPISALFFLIPVFLWIRLSA